MKTGKGNCIVAIHQPNFFPWLGFFDKISQADIFILLDNVPYSHGEVTNRVKLLFINNQVKWVTAPVKHEKHATKRIREVQIDQAKPWQRKMLTTLNRNYRRAPFYSQVYPFLDSLIMYDNPNLAEFNQYFIEKMTQKLELSTRIIKSSELPAGGSANDLLIELVQNVKGTTYLCGGGATDYFNQDRFASAGIDVMFQKFQHPVYHQRGNPAFFPGLSIIDVLMNIGFEEVRRILTH